MTRPVRASPRGVRYFLSEGAQAFRRNGLMSLAAVTVTVVTLVALGAALVVAGALDYVAHRLESQVQAVVYVKDGLPDAALTELHAQLESLPGVTGVTYVSKGEALNRLRKAIGSRAQFQDLLARNPLPASFVVEADHPDRLDAIAAAARRLPGVETASYGEDTVGRLLALTRVVRLSGAVVGGALALVALVIIASTIRLTVFARRAEIEVMRLVGATAWFIRWPFVVEGAITGACGAVLAFAAVAGLYVIVAHGARDSLPFLPLPAPEEVVLGLFWKLLTWGVVIGVVGSLLAVRRYLRV
ncbi:MAG TPA: permease-like cell division protein FtsX [bacterium]|nr:permease-like cell division protein FtsX [bacterium]